MQRYLSVGENIEKGGETKERHRAYLKKMGIEGGNFVPLLSHLSVQGVG